MVTSQTRFKIDLTKINELAVDAAFGANRISCNENGLSPAALEDKKSAIAVQEVAKLFVRQALECLTASGKRITPDDRRMIEMHGVEAIRRGADGVEYLSKFCYQ